MKAGRPEAVKLVVSLLTGDPTLFSAAATRLKERFGEPDLVSEPFEFGRTDYYEEELGGGLRRKLLAFDGLMDPGELAGIKLFTNGVEAEYSAEGRRRINIDPGYMALEKFVLASCKNFSHRIYIGSGVYAETTLIYEGKGFKTLEWTYPDYGAAQMKALLLEVRRRLSLRLGRSTGRSGGPAAKA
ncbi:MAG: DUF4416 family protein [Deltaproteobacteria bacterium]|nr:DUF4416 family protein [Deltaproteobacteria bacterium]